MFKVLSEVRWGWSEIPAVAEAAQAAQLEKNSPKVADRMKSSFGEDGSMLGSHTSQRSNEAVGCHINAVARWAALSLCGTAAGQTHSFMCVSIQWGRIRIHYLCPYHRTLLYECVSISKLYYFMLHCEWLMDVKSKFYTSKLFWGLIININNTPCHTQLVIHLFVTTVTFIFWVRELWF